MCISVLFETVANVFLCQVNSLFEFLADSTIQCLLVSFLLKPFFMLLHNIILPGILYLMVIKTISFHAMIIFWNMVIHLSFQPSLLHLLSPFVAIGSKFAYFVFDLASADCWRSCYPYCSQCGQLYCFPHWVSRKMHLPQVWTPAVFLIPQRDWSGQPSNIHSCWEMRSVVWYSFS